MWGEQVVKLIQEHGVGGLGGYDGCYCTNFSVCSINVDISCRKSGPDNNFFGIQVFVYSRHMDVVKDDLVKVGKAVVASLREGGGNHYDIKVRFLDPKHVYDKTCVYCNHALGASKSRYLCEECTSKETPFGESVQTLYDWSDTDFIDKGEDE